MKLLSDLVFFRTYAATLPTGHKESWGQCVQRLKDMHVAKSPTSAVAINWQLVENMVVLPSMRSLQFAGEAIERENLRLFNCSYTTPTKWKDFADILYLLTCGCGVGFSVEGRYVDQLPYVEEGVDSDLLWGIPDSREGWADSIQKLLSNPKQKFDYSLIRPAGSPLSTGGTASGSKPLRTAHEQIRSVLQSCGGILSPLDVLDIICYIADAIVVGGVRRSACIALCDVTDEQVMRAKEPGNIEGNYQRYRVNITCVVTEEQKREFLSDSSKHIGIHSPSGEPAYYVRPVGTELGLNPCGEILLRPRQLCNLTTVNLSKLTTINSVMEAIECATKLGTFQAAFTNFGYVDAEWKKNTEEDALLGVSFTGIAECPIGEKVNILLPFIADRVKRANASVAEFLGINVAKRIGCVKPEGTTSALCQTSSGIHDSFAPYYLRRVRLLARAPETSYLESLGVKLEVDKFSPDTKIITIPCKGKKGQGSLKLIERAIYFQKYWCKATANDGIGNNISITVYHSDKNRQEIIDTLLPESLRCCSFFPENNSAYEQAPFEACSKRVYDELVAYYKGFDIDFTQVNVSLEDDKRMEVIACSGGACEIK